MFSIKFFVIVSNLLFILIGFTILSAKNQGREDGLGNLDILPTVTTDLTLTLINYKENISWDLDYALNNDLKGLINVFDLNVKSQTYVTYHEEFDIIDQLNPVKDQYEIILINHPKHSHQQPHLIHPHTAVNFISSQNLSYEDLQPFINSVKYQLLKLFNYDRPLNPSYTPLQSALINNIQSYQSLSNSSIEAYLQSKLPLDNTHHLKSIHHLNKSLNSSLSLKSQLIHSKLSNSYSNLAYFNSSYLKPLHFPLEHKLAIYLPLIGPIFIPILISIKRLIKPIK